MQTAPPVGPSADGLLCAQPHGECRDRDWVTDSPDPGNVPRESARWTLVAQELLIHTDT